MSSVEWTPIGDNLEVYFCGAFFWIRPVEEKNGRKQAAFSVHPEAMIKLAGFATKKFAEMAEKAKAEIAGENSDIRH